MSRNYQEHPELYPWVEPMAREIEMDQNPDFQRFYAARLAEQEACTCTSEGGYGDDGSECRRTPKLGCPTHTEEDTEMGVFDEDDQETAAAAEDLAHKIDDALITIEARPLDGTMARKTSHDTH